MSIELLVVDLIEIAAIINFDGNLVDTIPQTVIANSDGEFSATFKGPYSSSLGDYPVIASQGDNSASTGHLR